MRKILITQVLALCALLGAEMSCATPHPAAEELPSGGSSSGGDPAPGGGPQGSEARRSAAPADGRLSRELGFALLRSVAEGGEDGVLVSPHGVASALLVAWNGAAGKTRDGIAQAVGLAPGAAFDAVDPAWEALDRALTGSDPDLELAIANSLWVRQGAELLPDFVERGRQAFRAELRSLDFAAAEAAGVINGWVERATRGKIDSIVPASIPPEVILYVINALYFKGKWTDPFDKEATRMRAFHPDGAESREVPMMERSARWGYLEDGGLRAVRLPYGEDRFAMYVALPPAGRLDAWLADLDGPTWERLVSAMLGRQGLVVLPRFRIETSAELSAPLSERGMAVAFSDAADFSAMTRQPVRISGVLHKTYIEVDEEGTEAAAATAVEIGVTSIEPPTPPFEFIADRPFFFAIRDDQTGTLLFVGLVRSLS